MFPLIAISAFFILGIAFFAIGKDDFGINRIKEDSKDNSSKDNEVNKNQEAISKNESTEGKDETNADSQKDKELNDNISIKS